jgi:hypothetical protein
MLPQPRGRLGGRLARPDEHERLLPIQAPHRVGQRRGDAEGRQQRRVRIGDGDQRPRAAQLGPDLIGRDRLLEQGHWRGDRIEREGEGLLRGDRQSLGPRHLCGRERLPANRQRAGKGEDRLNQGLVQDEST